MANKKCMVFETLGKVSDLQVQESKSDGLMRLSGVFGVAGVKNANNRVYDKDNYGAMVENLQQVIESAGCPGELEHPNSMNIDLNNVSHKIESIKMNEDGTITGTICLLNTPKGKTAQAIVEGGLPLYISSRGAGSITNEGKVTLSTIKTYDLVGTPGFSQAKLSLSENQKFENLNESLDEENTTCWAIVTESDDLLGGDDDDKKEKKDSGDDLLGGDDDKKEKKEKKSDDDKKDDKKDSDEEEKSDDNEDNNKKDNDNKVNMEDLKKSIDELSAKVNSLEAELHVAKESLEAVTPVNYSAIQSWITEEFALEFKNEINEGVEETVKTAVDEATENIAEGVQSWVTEEFAPEVQNWVCEEFAPEVQNWVCEEFAPEVQNWVCEEFAPEVQNWVCEEFAPEVQNWIVEEYSSTLEGWIAEEFSPEIQNKVNENVSDYLKNQNAARLENIDSLLESLQDNTNAEVEKIVAEQKAAEKYQGVYCVENMPAEYQASWELLNESRQNEIIRSSRMYDFTKNGVLENFWANVDFDKKQEPVNENVNVQANFQNGIAAQMMRLRGQF